MAEQELYRVWEHESEYENRTDIQPELDEDSGEWFKVIDNRKNVDRAAFCYPDFIEKNQIYAEDIQEAIIQHLIKFTKLTRAQLETCRFEFEDIDGNRWINSQLLTIRWKF